MSTFDRALLELLGRGLIMFRRGSAAVVAALAAVTLAIAGCGGGGSAKQTSGTPPKTSSGQPATIGLQVAGGLGKVLVDSTGRTLYLFQKDSRDQSACTDACAGAWPPLRASGKPVVGAGAKSSLVGTITRSDGKPQVTYDGHPLYLFDGDHSPGQTNGQAVTAFGAGWFALSSAGTAVSGTGSGGNSGY
jgi:predicted lipoprotein with Yx(FWY)xxD motif